jgi:hypothetical protein
MPALVLYGYNNDWIAISVPPCGTPMANPGGAAKKKKPFIRFGMTQDASNSNIHSYICGEMPILSCNTSGVEVMGLPSSLHSDGEPWGGRQKEKAFHSLR